jgi:hypothetical protein
MPTNKVARKAGGASRVTSNTPVSIAATKPPRALRIGPNIGKQIFQSMDTGRLLIAFLAFGAACSTLWAWMVANTGEVAVVDPQTARSRQ